MKKLIALLLTLVMAFSLVACGGGEEAEPEAEDVEVVEEEEAEVEEAEVEEAEDPDAPVSDESWDDLQTIYAQMYEVYTMVVEYYNQDEIKADEDVNELLAQAEELITQIGEIDRAALTEGTALELANSMVTVMEALNVIAENLETA